MSMTSSSVSSVHPETHSPEHEMPRVSSDASPLEPVLPKQNLNQQAIKPLDSQTQSPKTYIERISLTDFRNYQTAHVDIAPKPVVLTGANGAGKTNLLEAVSLFAPGNGLRRTAFSDLARLSATTPWAVSVRTHTVMGQVTIGTGLNKSLQNIASGASERASRVVRVDGEPLSVAALNDYLQVSWLIPAMDGLFNGAASERRRFLDRLISCFNPSYRKSVNQFERAMRQRNKLFEADGVSPILFEGLEVQMAETGVAIAAARCEAIARLQNTIKKRREMAEGDKVRSVFPWAKVALDGTLEQWLSEHAAVDVEDLYIEALAKGRHLDRAAKRTLTGPHRSDFLVGHGPKQMPAHYCSTGEQKALLVGLVLAHAELTKQLNDGHAPILLLDEIAAHLDENRRAGLFAEILALGTQAWMTGTDISLFSALHHHAQFFTVDNGQIQQTNPC